MYSPIFLRIQIYTATETLISRGCQLKCTGSSRLHLVYCAEIAWNCSGTCPSHNSTSKHLANGKEAIQPRQASCKSPRFDHYRAKGMIDTRKVVVALTDGRAPCSRHHPKLRPEAPKPRPKGDKQQRRCFAFALNQGQQQFKVEIQHGEPSVRRMQLSRWAGVGGGIWCSTLASFAKRTQRSCWN